MLVQGITRSNYDTVGAQRLASAESNLQSAIQKGASDKVLLDLQKTVDDLKNSIKVRENARQKYLDKLTLTERRVRESQFDEIKQKFDESNERSEKSAEKSRESIRAVSEKVGGALNDIFDSVAHTLLGPLNLIVNPLEQALGFNLFKVAKKPVADFIEGKFPSTYEKLKRDGGLIGAVGVAIIDAIHGKTKNASIESSESKELSGLLGGLEGVNFGTILKGAGIVALIAAAITGIIAGWKGKWDKNGLEESADLKKLMQDESASTWDKVKGVAVYALHSVFGAVTGLLRGFWDGLKKNWQEILDIWSDPESSTFEKIWDTIKTALFGLSESLWKGIGGFLSSIGDRVFGFFDENTQEWWINFKEKISETFSYMFDTIKNFFSWDNIKEQWESLKADPKQWIKDAWNGVTNFFNNIFSKIGQAFTGDDQFDFGTWAKEKIDDLLETIKNFFSDVWDKIKHAVSNAWDSATGWLTGRRTENVVDANGNLILDANGNPVTKETTWMSRAADKVSSWMPWNWGKKTAINDAIISKDNDLYIPSNDDNILVTKSNITTQPTTTNSEFQTELLNLLKNIAENLKQPTVINNVQQPNLAIDFGGMRL